MLRNVLKYQLFVIQSITAVQLMLESPQTFQYLDGPVVLVHHTVFFINGQVSGIGSVAQIPTCLLTCTRLLGTL